jgi:DNA-binding LytR/AlgR family response regulator
MNIELDLLTACIKSERKAEYELQHGLTSKPMHEWSDRLPPNVFCRIHRSTIVNMNYTMGIENEEMVLTRFF